MSNSFSPSTEDLTDLAEKLHTVFTEPWANLDTDIGTHVDEVNSLLKVHPAPLPSIGQGRTTLMHLKPKKATGADKIPA